MTRPAPSRSKFLSSSIAGCAGLGVLIAVSSTSPAQAIAITAGIDNLSGQTSDIGFPITLGYEFSLSNAATVNALGSYDSNGDGLSGTYTVGLWDVAGTLLASATVGTGDQLASSFRWADITDITLGPGNYIVASAGNWGFGDYYLYSGSFTTNQLTYVTDRYDIGATLAFPVSSFGGYAPGFLGGNVSFASTTSTTSTSVPGPLPLLGVAAAFAYSRKLRNRIKMGKTPEVMSTID